MPVAPARLDDAEPTTATVRRLLLMASATWGKGKSACTRLDATEQALSSPANAAPAQTTSTAATKALMPRLPRGLRPVAVWAAPDVFLLRLCTTLSGPPWQS